MTHETNHIQDILDKQRRRSIRLVVIGNFLEYYDLTLFIHLTFILNPIFIPKGDPAVETIMKVFMFCSAYLMRPVGALFWGWIGDKHGRTLVLTSTMTLMGIASTAVTAIPSYDTWGYWSTAAVILTRFIQGFAAGGEAMAASIYMTETTPLPKAYFAESFVSSTCFLGQMVSGAVVTVCLYLFPDKGWMIPFWIGGGISVFGSLARQTLKETPDFIRGEQFKERIQVMDGQAGSRLWKIRFTLILMHAMSSVMIFFTFGYCPETLASINIPAYKITLVSTLVSSICAIKALAIGFLASKTGKPFLIFKSKAVLLTLIFACLSCINMPQSFAVIIMLQFIGAFLESGDTPLSSLFTKSFPVKTRCRNMMLTWAVTKAVMYLFTAITLSYISKNFGMNGVIVILFAFSVLYCWSGFYAQKLLEPVRRRIMDEQARPKANVYRFKPANKG